MTEDLMTFFAHKIPGRLSREFFFLTSFKVKALYFSHDKKR